MEELLKALFARAGLEIADREKELLALHWQLLYAANQQFNLTAIAEEQAAAEKHYLDSLLILPRLQELIKGRDAALVDIGSGGGFPGLPLAVCLPEAAVTLLEATGKKCAFLTECGERLGLHNLTVRKLRAEEAGRVPALRGGFDLAAARAVAGLPALLEYALPLLKTGGRLLAYKGADYEREIAAAGKALEILGGSVAAAHHFLLPQSREQRHIVEIVKEKPTPDLYPRRPGLPGKKPL